MHGPWPLHTESEHSDTAVETLVVLPNIVVSAPSVVIGIETKNGVVGVVSVKMCSVGVSVNSLTVVTSTLGVMSSSVPGFSVVVINDTAVNSVVSCPSVDISVVADVVENICSISDIGTFESVDTWTQFSLQSVVVTKSFIPVDTVPKSIVTVVSPGFDVVVSSAPPVKRSLIDNVTGTGVSVDGTTVVVPIPVSSSVISLFVIGNEVQVSTSEIVVKKLFIVPLSDVEELL